MWRGEREEVPSFSIAVRLTSMGNKGGQVGLKGLINSAGDTLHQRCLWCIQVAVTSS